MDAASFSIRKHSMIAQFSSEWSGLYNPKSHQWSLNWTNSTNGVMTNPMIGGFVHGQGQFYDLEEFQGRSIYSQRLFRHQARLEPF
jgi:hypothetical protein